MARISVKNPMHRSKNEISSDLAFILNAKQLHPGTKQSVLDQVLWTWSEFEGKHKGCKYWSEKARGRGLKTKGLIHEHLIPRKILREKIIDLKNPTPEDIYNILQNLCIGVVITAKEDKKLNELKLGSSMPPNWDGKNKWARYIEANIKITPEPAD